MSPRSIPVHLLVLVHGMWGHPSHLKQLVHYIQRRFPISGEEGTKLWVLNVQTNSNELTYDGIDWGGERVVDEIDDEVKRIENEGGQVTHFSVTGYSLGGLIARYVVGILYHRGFFNKVEPVNFNTIATPHIGLPRYASLMSALFAACAKYLSRTGEQFYCLDKWSATERPLLEVMADPDQIFYKALALFRYVRIYANAVNDVTVPYVTGAIELEDPFADPASSAVQIELDEDYHPIIKKYTLPPNPFKPAVLSARWFRRFKPSSKRLFLPLQHLKLPLHKKVILYTLLPFLLTVGISLALSRFKRDSKTSRSRLRDLESESYRGKRLIHAFAQLEEEAETVVIDVLEGLTASGSPSQPSQMAASSSTDNSAANDNDDAGQRTPVATEPTITADSAHPQTETRFSQPRLRRTIDQPKLTARQKRMVEQLNQLPLIKTLSFFEGVRNAHALIVCRDADYFPEMWAGKNVLKHWANAFVL